MHQNRSHHHHGTAEGSFTAKKWFGHRAGRSPCAHSIGKFFLCYIDSPFFFWNFRPRLARELLVYMRSISDCDALILRGMFLYVRDVRQALQRELGQTFLPWVTWFDKTFKSLLTFLPNTWELANWSLPLSLSPSTLVRSFDVKISSVSLVSSSTRSPVLDTKHSKSPDTLRSICTPRTLHNESNAMSLCLDILQPKSEKNASTQKSTCLDSLRRARHRKWSKYAHHKSRSKDVPIFHVASETLRKAVWISWPTPS